MMTLFSPPKLQLLKLPRDGKRTFFVISRLPKPPTDGMMNVFCKILFFSKVIRCYIVYKAGFNQTELRPISTAEVGQPPSVDPVACGLLYPRKGPSSLHSSKTEWSVALTSLELVCSNQSMETWKRVRVCEILCTFLMVDT